MVVGVAVLAAAVVVLRREAPGPPPAEGPPTSVASTPASSPTPAATPPALVIPPTPPKPGMRGTLPPLPLGPMSRRPEIVRAAYQFAARHPEVLQYVPCFCGCENSGHHANDDCFVRSRDAAGNVQWEPHGMT